MQFLSLVFMRIITAVLVGSSVPSKEGSLPDSAIPGHLKPLGYHRKPETEGVDRLEEPPFPRDFFQNYVKKGKPFLLPGWAKRLPVYHSWTDEYLETNYGEILVDVEMGKKENRSQSMMRTPFKNFLQYYNDTDIYLVHSLPLSMRDEVQIPRSLLCGGFTDLLVDFVMWFSSGGTKSVLHFDGLDNINCLFDGSKEVFMINKDFDLHLDIPSRGYSTVDVDRVDMLKFPQFQNVPWYNVTMEKGDCLFIPYRWFHQVRSTGRNLAINLWFLHMLKFKEEDCEVRGQVPDFAPSSQFKLRSGEADQLRHEIGSFIQTKTPFQHLAYEDVPTLCSFIGQKSCDFDEFFDLLDKNRDDIITLEEVTNVDPARWNNLFAQIAKERINKAEDEEEAVDDSKLNDNNIDEEDVNGQISGIRKEENTQKADDDEVAVDDFAEKLKEHFIHSDL